jgi:hypothetical protein
VTSVIGCENTLAGDPSSDWQEAGAGDSTLQGFATSMSVNVGQTVSFKVKSTASAYHIDILRLGYYQAAATVPGALTNMVATAGNGSATVNWTAPSNGGSAITSYTITPYVGTTARASTTISGSPPATSATITGLTNGSTYTFKVSATNAIGTGPQSAASNAVKACGLICL